MKDLSIITVTYCSEKQIEKLIRSVQEGCKEIFYEHIVIDNASTDFTGLILKQFESEIIYKENKKNLGFSAANILGYQLSKGRYILFLNPDMEVEPKSLDKLVSWMDENPKTGIAGCRLVDEDGKLNQEASPKRFPTVRNQLFLLLKLHCLFPNYLDTYFYKDLDFSKEQIVDSVRGSFMMMRREFIDATGWPFDPRYFIWFEDVDICQEAKRRGFHVKYLPFISCKDAIGQSFKQQNRKWKFRQYSESLLVYFKKWEPFYIWIWALLIYRPVALCLGSKSFLKLKKYLYLVTHPTHKRE